MKASVNRAECIGCGLCADLCPAVFEMGDDGIAAVHGEVTPENEADARAAEDACPVSAILIEE